MAVEGVATLVLLVRPSGLGLPMVWLGAVLVAVALGSTVLLSVPFHNRLANGFNADDHRGLVVTNWIRTGAWTFRGLLSSAMLLTYLGT